MNDTNLMVLNYLSDVYHIKDTSVEGVEKAIDDIFNFENILPQYRSLFNSIMVDAIDFELISERLTFKKMKDQFDKEGTDCRHADDGGDRKDAELWRGAETR